ncbi:MAG: class I tRNA ligase family protein, partial [Acidobacteria bacterium]|nr:class I tRNA ligase family protein [Acidobacteriota bacterium]
KKLRIQSGEHSHVHLRNLLRVFEIALRLLHPVMPFITEELWQRLLKRHDSLPESICLAPFPQAGDACCDEEAARDFALLQEMITSARALRADQKLDPKQTLEGLLYPANETTADLARESSAILDALTNTRFQIRAAGAARIAGASRSTPEFEIVLQLSGAQADAMRQRLQKEIDQLNKVIESSRRQLGSESFTAKAPAHVIEGIRAKLADYEAQLAKSLQALQGQP